MLRTKINVLISDRNKVATLLEDENFFIDYRDYEEGSTERCFILDELLDDEQVLWLEAKIHKLTGYCKISTEEVE